MSDKAEQGAQRSEQACPKCGSSSWRTMRKLGTVTKVDRCRNCAYTKPEVA